MSIPEYITTKTGWSDEKKEGTVFYVLTDDQTKLIKSALKEVRVAKDIESFDQYFIFAKEESKNVFITDWQQIGLSIPVVIVQFNYYLYGNNKNKNLDLVRIGQKLGTFFASNILDEKTLKFVEGFFKDPKNLATSLKYFHKDTSFLKSFALHEFLPEEQNIPKTLMDQGYGLELGETLSGKKTIDISPTKTDLGGEKAGYFEALASQSPPIILLKPLGKKTEYSWSTTPKAAKEEGPTGGSSADFKNLCDIILAETIKSYLL